MMVYDVWWFMLVNDAGLMVYDGLTLVYDVWWWLTRRLNHGSATTVAQPWSRSGLAPARRAAARAALVRQQTLTAVARRWMPPLVESVNGFMCHQPPTTNQDLLLVGGWCWTTNWCWTTIEQQLLTMKLVDCCWLVFLSDLCSHNSPVKDYHCTVIHVWSQIPSMIFVWDHPIVLFVW